VCPPERPQKRWFLLRELLTPWTGTGRKHNERNGDMKSSDLKRSHSTAWWCGMLAGLAALLVWASPAAAGEKQSVEAVASYLSFDFGQTSVTPSGNIHLNSMGAVCVVVSANPLVTGRLTWVGDFQGDGQLNGSGSGTGNWEVGTWDLSSGVPIFKPSPAGGLWVTKWEARGSLAGLGYTGKFVAHGVAGEVEGMQENLEFAGGGLTDYYTGQILDPHAKK
jgi:hypothetical protein